MQYKTQIRYLWWLISGYVSRSLSLDTAHRVTVLVTYFHPIRMKYIDAQIRNILKCTFVEKIVISNHNSDVKIEEKAKIRDKRVIYINQQTKRACGYRWRIAKELQAEYLVALDDDILMFPFQLKTLVEHLIQEPEIPHGLTGMIHLQDNQFQFREREDIDVHYLCEVYAVTQQHIKQYFEIEAALAKQDKTLPETVEKLGDFIVISQAGIHNPKIHKAQRLFRSETFKTVGIANHKEQQFGNSMLEVSQAVQKLRH